MASKAQKRIWTPTEYAVQIGENEYIIAPQPIGSFIKFSDMVDALGKGLDEIPDDAELDQVLGVLLRSPYLAFSVLIPGLLEDDIESCSLPQLKFLFDLVIEVNGVDWLRTFVKNSIGPLLPRLITSAVAGINGTSRPSMLTEIPVGEAT